MFKECGRRTTTEAYLSYKLTKCSGELMSQLIGLWFLAHRGPAKAQVSLRIRTVLPEPSLFALMKYGGKTKGPTINACAFEE